MTTVNEIIGTVFSCDGANLEDTDTPDTISQWDSMTHIILISALEEQFDVTFSDKELAEIATIGEVRKAMKKKLST